MDVLKEDSVAAESLPDPHKELIAELRVSANRWFLMVLVLVAFSAILIFFCWYAFGKAERNQEIIYVKLQPNGTWSVIDYQPEDNQLYFKTTIDSSLEKYAIARYKADPATIADDWGRAAVFMSPDMEAFFLDKDGYDAWGKLDRIKKTNTKATIKIRDIEHYDEVSWKPTDGSEYKAIRSNIYLTRTITKNGRKEPPELLVLSLQWRLVDKKTLVKEPIEHLRHNPIGVEILNEELKKERTSD